MNSIERRKDFLINLVYTVSIIALFYLFIKYAFWPLSPILFAFLIAVILQKPVDKLCKRFKFKRGIVSVLLVLLVIAIIGTLIGLLGSKIVQEFKEFAGLISVKIQDPDWIENITRSTVSKLPGFVQHSLADSTEKFLESMRSTFENGGTAGDVATTHFNLKSILSPSIEGVLNTAKHIPTVLIAILVTIISCCFITADYKRVTDLIKSFFPKEKRFVFSRAKKLLFASLGKLAKAYGIIILITFTEMLVGLSILKILNIYTSNYVFVIAIITAIVDILPIFGTGTIIWPWSLYSFIMGNTKMGIGLIFIYIAITIIRQIMEPKLVATQLDLPPALTICAMYIGLQMFGFIGMFLMPITLFCLKLLNDDGIIHITKSEPSIKKDL